MASWEEVKRLAADFQKVQLSSSTQRLSERNCVEIISWLIDRKLIDLIFTSDGKEYMTPTQLVQDILAELYVNGGRVNFIELSKIIGVDLNHINTYVPEVMRGRKDIYSVLGQLIDTSYIIKIAGEINQKLAQQGQLNVGELTIQYDLPADFLQHNVLDKYLGKLIHGEQDKNDPKVYFTESFIARTKAKIKGALVAITKPTSISIILNQIDVKDKMFFSLFEQLSPYGFLTARTTTAMYVPNVYSRSQNEWVQNFYKQNGYVEFDALIRLGINDAKAYLKKQFVNENIMTLKSCVISQNLLERIEADIDECISSKSYVDLQSNLPNALNDDDIKLIVDKVLTLQKQRNIIILGNYLLSKAFIESLMKECEIYLQDQVKRLVESGGYQQYQTDLRVSNKPQKGDDLEEKVDKREERRKKAAGGKSGGGTQGRETKTKSTKKPTKMVKNEEDDRDEVGVSKKVSLQVVSVEDVEKLIEKRVDEEGLSEIVDDIANYAAPILNSNGLEIARKLYETTVADRTAARRHTHNDAQNKVNALLGDVRLFEKGVKCFTVDAQQNLYKYLLKTVCLDILNELLDYIASERGLNIDADKFNNEQRQKFINDLPVEYKSSFQILLKTLLGQNLDEFMTAVEECLTLCSMILKKIDKKKDRLIILNHKHSLLEQLDKCEDPALVLHLSSLVIFITATQCMLHCSGRHVSTVLTYLKQYLTSEHSSELCSYHDLVTLLLNNGSEEESIKEQLKEKMSVIKAIANDFKKGTSDKS